MEVKVNGSQGEWRSMSMDLIICRASRDFENVRALAVLHYIISC